MKIEDKLLEGFAYRNAPTLPRPGERKMNIQTGYGGAKEMIKAYRKIGLTDDFIETLIEVNTEKYGWQPLSIVKVKEDEISRHTDTLKDSISTDK